MNILSLFDGISCLQVALNRAGIKYNNYFASEVDKYAISITQKNFPDTKQIGDIHFVSGERLPKIDLLCGGSPCQNLSIAGDRKGLKGSKSQLFWEYVRVLREVKPKYFILENVASMKKEDRDIITREIGVDPIMINSALVSAQSRKRLYWTNIPVVQPEDKKIYLKNILESGYTERDKSLCITASYQRTDNLENYIKKKRKQLIFEKPIRIGQIGKGGQGDRIYSTEGKSVSLSALGGGRGAKTGLYLVNKDVRKLSPVECERLQTLPDNYTKYIAIDSYILYINEVIIKNKVKLCNAKFMDVKEKPIQKNMEMSVFYITKGLKGMEVLNYQKNKNNQKKNVNIAIERLEKKEAEQEECVIDITKIGLGTATHSIQTILENSSDLEDIKNELTVKTYTGKYMKIMLEENYCLSKKCIISILIKLIIELKIYTYVRHKVNIQFYIKNLKQLQGDWLKVELSDLKMENIILNSNAQRYKMLGNGFTVDVIAHILKGIL